MPVPQEMTFPVEQASCLFSIIVPHLGLNQIQESEFTKPAT